MKRLLAILMAIFMVASVFTACGDEKKSDSSDDKKTESTAGDNNGGTNNGDANNGGTNNGGLGGLGGLGGNNGGDTQVSTTPDDGNTNNGGSTNSAIVGKYMIYSITENGQTANYAQIIELGMDSLSVVFNANGTFSLSAIEEGTLEGTYTDSTMTANGEERSYTFDGEKVIISFEGTSITFVREGSDLFETNNGGDADGSYDSALIGTWTTTIEEDGASLYMTWTFKNGGALTITAAYDGETVTGEAEWYTSDGVIFATNENGTEELKYTVNGATLEVEEDGEIVTFHKV